MPEAKSQGSTCHSTAGLCPGAESALGERGVFLVSWRACGCGARMRMGMGWGWWYFSTAWSRRDAFRHTPFWGHLILAPSQSSCAPWAAADAEGLTSSHSLAHRARGSCILPHWCTGMERQPPVPLGMVLWVRTLQPLPLGCPICCKGIFCTHQPAPCAQHRTPAAQVVPLRSWDEPSTCVIAGSPTPADLLKGPCCLMGCLLSV